MSVPKNKMPPRGAIDRAVSTRTHPPRRRDRPRIRKRRHWLTRLLQIVALVYLIGLIALCLAEDRLVYPGAFVENSSAGIPAAIDAALLGDPVDVAAIGIGRLVTVNYLSGGANPDAAMLPGRMRLLLTGDGNLSRDWLIFFHGNGIRAADLDGWLTELGDGFTANVFAAEYRGFTDDRDVSETGVQNDGLAAVEFVTQTFGVPPRRMVFYGRSLGGGVAAAAAIRYPPAGLVMDRTFDSAVNVAAARYWYVPVRWLMKSRFDSAARMRRYAGPLVVVHGTGDTLVPYAAGRRLYDAATTHFKTMIDVPDIGHLDPMPPASLNEVVTQLRRLIGEHAARP